MSARDHDFDDSLPTRDWGPGENWCLRCEHFHWVHDDPRWPDDEHPGCVCLPPPPSQKVGERTVEDVA